MGPYKFKNGTVYLGEWSVIFYFIRTENPMEEENIISRINPISKESLCKDKFKVIHSIN